MGFRHSNRISDRLDVFAVFGAIAVVVGVPHAVCGDDSLRPPWRFDGVGTYQAWAFETSANPASPEQAANPYGMPTASITVGSFGTGWRQQLGGLGTKTGYWDIGAVGGEILVDIPDTLDSYPRTLVSVQVTYFEDLSQPPTVTVLGAVLLEDEVAVSEGIPTGGYWYVHRSTWQIMPSASSHQVVITSDPDWGSVVDAVIVDTIVDCSAGYGDFDCDGDVDMRDYSVLAAVLASPDQAYGIGDLDGDNSIDLHDVAVFVSQMTGPN